MRLSTTLVFSCALLSATCWSAKREYDIRVGKYWKAFASRHNRARPVFLQKGPQAYFATARLSATEKRQRELNKHFLTKYVIQGKALPKLSFDQDAMLLYVLRDSGEKVATVNPYHLYEGKIFRSGTSMEFDRYTPLEDIAIAMFGPSFFGDDDELAKSFSLPAFIFSFFFGESAWAKTLDLDAAIGAATAASAPQDPGNRIEVRNKDEHGGNAGLGMFTSAPNASVGTTRDTVQLQ